MHGIDRGALEVNWEDCQVLSSSDVLKHDYQKFRIDLVIPKVQIKVFEFGVRREVKKLLKSLVDSDLIWGDVEFEESELKEMTFDGFEQGSKTSWCNLIAE